MNGGAAVALSRQAAASSLLVGLTTMAILFCSHFHQIEGDLSCRQDVAAGAAGGRPGASRCAAPA